VHLMEYRVESLRRDPFIPTCPSRVFRFSGCESCDTCIICTCACVRIYIKDTGVSSDIVTLIELSRRYIAIEETHSRGGRRTPCVRRLEPELVIVSILRIFARPAWKSRDRHNDRYLRSPRLRSSARCIFKKMTDARKYFAILRAPRREDRKLSLDDLARDIAGEQRRKSRDEQPVRKTTLECPRAIFADRSLLSGHRVELMDFQRRSGMAFLRCKVCN